MTGLYLLDPEATPAWFPFADSRPIAELRAGAWLIRERWEAAAGYACAEIFGARHLATFVEPGVPAVTARHAVAGPAIVGRSDFAPTGDGPAIGEGPARLVNDGVTVGWWVSAGLTWDGGEGAEERWPPVDIAGVPLRGAFDLVTALEHLLPADVADFTQEGGDALPNGSIVIGGPEDVVILGAGIEPGVVFDVREGVVVVEQNCYVQSGTRLVGPLYVGPGTEVLGGPIRGCAIGPRCRVRGEMSATVLLGYANKAHDGFVGHSVVGRWANLGAGTITSNLKNTYGNVRLDVNGAALETGRQFLGSLIGDHAKTAIGTLLNTGTVVGAGANLFHAHPPKYTPPFAWGRDGTMQQDGFLAVAERVMARRDIAVTPDVRRALIALHDHATR